MGNAESVLEIPLEISDVSGQKVFSVTNAPTNNTVGKLVHEMLGKMNLPRKITSSQTASTFFRDEEMEEVAACTLS